MAQHCQPKALQGSLTRGCPSRSCSARRSPRLRYFARRCDRFMTTPGCHVPSRELQTQTQRGDATDACCCIDKAARLRNNSHRSHPMMDACMRSTRRSQPCSSNPIGCTHACALRIETTHVNRAPRNPRTCALCWRPHGLPSRPSNGVQRPSKSVQGLPSALRGFSRALQDFPTLSQGFLGPSKTTRILHVAGAGNALQRPTAPGTPRTSAAKSRWVPRNAGTLAPLQRDAPRCL